MCLAVASVCHIAVVFFFFQAEDGIRDIGVTGVQTCALPIFDTSKAWDIPGVHLVLTGEMMATRNLAWMPTLSYDTQAVLATDKVRFQGQEVACVIADDPYIAKDACETIDVEYEPLSAIVNPEQAVAEGAPVIRDDKENQTDNVIYHSEVGDSAGTDR